MFRKFFLSLIVLTLVPLIALTVIYYSYLKEQITVSSKKQVKERSEWAIQTLQNLVQDSSRQLRFVAGMSLSRIAFKYGRPEAMTTVLDHLKGSSQLFTHLVAIDRNGQIFASDSQTRSLIENRQGFQKRLLSRLAPHRNLSLVDNGRYLSVVEKISDDSGVVVGTLNVLLEMQPVEAYVSRHIGSGSFSSPLAVRLTYSPRQPSKGEALDVSEDRNVIASCGPVGLIIGLDQCVSVEESFLSGPLMILRKISFGIGLVVLILMLIISYVITRSLLAPVKRIAASLGIHSDPSINVDRDPGSFEQIESSIVKLISQKIQIEKKLAESERLATIGSLAGMMAHDIRKPFSQLKAMLEMGDALFKEPSMLHRFKGEVDTSIRNVETMLSDIINYSKQIKLSLKSCNLQEILLRSLKETAEFSKAHDIEIIMDLKHGRAVKVDENNMVRVFENILSNAIDQINLHRDQYGSRIKIESYRKGKVIQLNIQNDGPPIRNEDEAHLFKAFFTKGKPGGTGLGLASCQRIVKGHGGEIFTSNTNGAVIFSIVIPSESGDPPANDYFRKFPIGSLVAEEEKKTLLATINSHHKVGMLLLEDEVLYRAAVRDLLRQDPDLDKVVNLYECSNVSEALELIKGHDNIRYAIVDVDLSENLTGYDFIREAKSLRPDMYFLVHSNRCSTNDKLRAYELGAQKFVAKPLGLSSLVEFVSMGQSKLKSISPPPEVDRKGQIIVIDDCYLVLSAWKLKLGDQRNRLFSSSDDFFEYAERDASWTQKTGAVVLDMRLGDDSSIEGVELAKRVRSLYRGLIFLSSGMDAPDEIKEYVDVVIDKQAYDSDELISLSVES